MNDDGESRIFYQFKECAVMRGLKELKRAEYLKTSKYLQPTECVWRTRDDASIEDTRGRRRSEGPP